MWLGRILFQVAKWAFVCAVDCKLSLLLLLLTPVQCVVQSDEIVCGISDLSTRSHQFRDPNTTIGIEMRSWDTIDLPGQNCLLDNSWVIVHHAGPRAQRVHFGPQRREPMREHLPRRHSKGLPPCLFSFRQYFCVPARAATIIRDGSISRVAASG